MSLSETNKSRIFLLTYFVSFLMFLALERTDMKRNSKKILAIETTRTGKLYTVAHVVEAMRYKPECRAFDYR